MVNLTSCKMYIKQVDGKLDTDLMLQKINTLKQEHRIYQDILVYQYLSDASVEVRFGASWFPDTDMLEEIFPPSEYELWILSSNQDPCSDYIDYYPSEKSSIEEVNECALYKFDAIQLHGDIEAIQLHLNEQRNFLSLDARPYFVQDNCIHLNESGIYTASNYFVNDEESQIHVSSIDTFPFVGAMRESRFWDMIWNSGSIDFRSRFYDNNLERRSSGSKYHCIDKIVFTYKGQVTNILEQAQKNEWVHTASNGFSNLVNPSFVLFKHMNLRT